MVVLRRMTLRLRLERTAVTECGYRNSAIAEPRASVAYAHWACGAVTSEPRGFPVAGFSAANA
ncbi:hypothetical protein GCM10020000_26900 [Streptomyces olivoverticillatus]